MGIIELNATPMKTYIARLLTIAVLLLNGFLFAQTNPNHVWVNGYTKSNGTYVEGHYRTAPNSTNRDNFSTDGNTNPYTGKPGWIPADNNPLRVYNNNSTNTGTSTYTYTPANQKPTSYDITQYYKSTSNSYNTKQNHYSGIPPSSSVTYYTTTSLRLRGGASTNDEIVLTMPAGASVKVVNDFDSWAYVYYNGYYGYASADYLSATPNVEKVKDRFNVDPVQLPDLSKNANLNAQNNISTIPSGYSNSGNHSGKGNGSTALFFVIGIGLFVWWLRS